MRGWKPRISARGPRRGPPGRTPSETAAPLACRAIRRCPSPLLDRSSGERTGETQPVVAETKILDNLLVRARNWRDVEPLYPDQTRGIPKTSESRAIEAVMNAVVLPRQDGRSGRFGDDTRTSLDVMWSLQMKTGPNSGARSDGYGTALACLALQSAGAQDHRVTKGLDWLRQHQDGATGRWTATSLNSKAIRLLNRAGSWAMPQPHTPCSR